MIIVHINFTFTVHKVIAKVLRHSRDADIFFPFRFLSTMTYCLFQSNFDALVIKFLALNVSFVCYGFACIAVDSHKNLSPELYQVNQSKSYSGTFCMSSWQTRETKWIAVQKSVRFSLQRRKVFCVFVIGFQNNLNLFCFGLRGLLGILFVATVLSS